MHNGNHRQGPKPHQNGTMRICFKAVWVVLFTVLLWCQCPAQGKGAADSVNPHTRSNSDRFAERKHTLNADERSSVVSVAFDARKLRYSEHDCSHLVHAIYARAGFPYAYATSDDIYTGVVGFQRVSRPQPGDLVVWHGHVGIVTRPSRHSFLSFLSRGPGIDDYKSRYWRRRGEPRFYRYVKHDGCAGCTMARSRTDR